MPRSPSVPEPQFFSQPRFCPNCGLPVVIEGALFCKQCGARLGQSGAPAGDHSMHRVLAFALSAIPGAGHVYQGHPWRGIGWFFGVVMAYGSSPQLGLIIHLVCAANAALYDRMHRGRMMRRRRGRTMSATLRP
jgi:hypothetical protein